ncbi:uncharacterized protein F4812DRAFT_456106 [Daldinia caldariorum]|uniref:uncharacterized protein n=1 Tax=Daldinia caldariorum TaxID=326644 RepID=UPI002007A403|nr:uncharacterized protein F4812DRAFT_456106 [Daldinia caldariorum]KAI1472005.1 hypothetical protein F4812DRAFT_456106 [Daldinia caldariorum]
MSKVDKLLQQYEGEIVPRSFRGGFVFLSYLVSYIGAALTLELLNRRISWKGLSNHLVLVSAAVSMGGISIWCMHFVGNQAIVLGDGEPELLIDYASHFSALTFFLPVIILLLAFTAIGAKYMVSGRRICCGGVLAGGGICGMYYLGNASMTNYDCIYGKTFIAGAVVIAVAASIMALSLFFLCRASWKNSWKKRSLSAFLLSGAVSGMHWVAAVGTNYRLKYTNGNPQLSESSHYNRHMPIDPRAQQIVLAAAVFDKSGRILVNPDGLLPSEKITDTYVEKSQGDTFGIAHPLFHWMFQVSRDWNSVVGMVDGMAKHLARLPKDIRDTKIRLVDDDGNLIGDYDTIFRELFCVAAMNLATMFKEKLVDIGILWDEILATGVDELPHTLSYSFDNVLEKGGPSRYGRAQILRTMFRQEHGRGLLMFLVRHLEHSVEVDRLEAAGFRFAEPHQVCGIIGSRMKIKSRDLKGKLRSMATLAEGGAVLHRGVHLGFFGVKARVGSFGFDVVVKKDARNLLPTMPIPLERLESWQMDVIRRLGRIDVPLLLQNLDALRKLSPREALFASQLSDALQSLRAWIDNPVFDEAILTSRVVQVPCRARAGLSSESCTMIALCMMMPIHAGASSPRCEFIPMNFFKIHQMAYKNSPHLAAFTRYVHRGLSPTANTVPIDKPPAIYQRAGRAILWRTGLGSLRRFRRTKTEDYATVEEGCSTPTELVRRHSNYDSNEYASTINRCSQGYANRHKSWSDTISDQAAAQQSSSFGGIMVSQEIQVDIIQIDDVSGGGASAPSKSPVGVDRVTMVKAGAGFDFGTTAPLSGVEEDNRAVAEREKANDAITFVDELFAICVDGL